MFMKINEYKTVKISPELHKTIKKYCVNNDLKMNNWIEEQLEKVINEIDNIITAKVINIHFPEFKLLGATYIRIPQIRLPK